MEIFTQAESGINPSAEDYMATKIAYILRPEAILSNYWGGYGFVKGTTSGSNGTVLHCQELIP